MKLGLVLGGGFARGAAQLGFLKGFFEYFPLSDVKIISSSSIGAVNALALSYDKLDYAENIYRNFKFESVKNLRNSIKSNLIPDIFDRLSENSEIKIPVYITGTCIGTFSTHYFYVDNSTPKSEVLSILDISITFPFINGIVKKRGKKIYFDGGAFDNNPVYPLRYHDLDFILILHSAPNYIPPFDVIEKGINVIDIETTSCCNKKISSFSIKKDNIHSMLDSAYEYGKKFGSLVMSAHDDIDLKEALKKFKNDENKNENNPNRFTSLTLVEFLNRLFVSMRIR